MRKQKEVQKYLANLLKLKTEHTHLDKHSDHLYSVLRGTCNSSYNFESWQQYISTNVAHLDLGCVIHSFWKICSSSIGLGWEHLWTATRSLDWLGLKSFQRCIGCKLQVVATQQNPQCWIITQNVDLTLYLDIHKHCGVLIQQSGH